MLYVLLALAKPTTRIIFITSSPLDYGIVEYYVSLLPEPARSTAKDRVCLLSVCDTNGTASLAEKICQRPRLLNRLKSMINPNEAVLNVFRGTEFELDIAKQLGLPLYSAKPRDQKWGSKAGSRLLFQKLNIPCAAGTYETCKNVEDLITQMLNVLCGNSVSYQRGIVKLVEGFSGKGNAIIDLSEIQHLRRRLSDASSDTMILRRATQRALETMDFCSKGRTWEEYLTEVKTMGVIFEVFIESENAIVTSPSVQVVVNEDRTVSVLSTHEQVLDGQIYIGCRFPANERYRGKLMEYGRCVGEYFAQHDIVDHFSIDFICLYYPKREDWSIYAIEVNLRITGTTHPWMTLKLLTHGQTDPQTGLFYSNCAKYYIASDNIVNPALRRLVPMDIKDIFDENPQLKWSPERQTGVICHLLGCVSENGKIGMTSIANSPSQAQLQFENAVNLFSGDK